MNFSKRSRLWDAALYSGLALCALAANLAYSFRLPWGGDEWYTYYAHPSVMAFPNGLLVFAAKKILGEVSLRNYLIYRQIGTFWLVSTLAFLFFRAQGNPRLRPLILLHFAFLSFSAFVIHHVQVFRYYGFYLFCSVLVFYLVYQTEASPYAQARKRLFSTLALSPFLNFLITWQLGIYILIREALQLDKRRRTILLILYACAGALAYVFRYELLRFALPLVYPAAALTGREARGLTLGLLAQPLYAAFQFIYGYDLEPTASDFVASLFLATALAFLYRLWRLRKDDRALFKATLSAGIVPFLLMFWLLKPCTPPGATQFGSFHALFFAPFFVAVFAPRSRRPGSGGNLSLLPSMVLLGGTLAGLCASLSAPRVQWSKVVQMAQEVQDKNGVIFTDGRASGDFFFYGDGKIDPSRVRLIYEKPGQAALKSSSRVMIILNDWQSYQVLTQKQDWHTGESSEGRFLAASNFLRALRATKVSVRSYARYPLYAFVYEKSAPGGPAINQPSPSCFQLPYSDLALPIAKGDLTVLGCQDVRKGDPFGIRAREPGRLSVFYFLEDHAGLKTGTRIGELRSAGQRIPLRIGGSQPDAYRSTYSRSLEGGLPWYQWEKRPTFTYSLRYPGSMFRSIGNIYRSDFEIKGGGSIAIENPDVSMHLCALKMGQTPR